MNEETITDKQIKIQALQHLLIYYEKLAKKSINDEITKTSNRYIAKIRRTLIRMLESNEEIKKVEPIQFYK